MSKQSGKIGLSKPVEDLRRKTRGFPHDLVRYITTGGHSLIDEDVNKLCFKKLNLTF